MEERRALIAQQNAEYEHSLEADNAKVNLLFWCLILLLMMFFFDVHVSGAWVNIFLIEMKEQL